MSAHGNWGLYRTISTHNLLRDRIWFSSNQFRRRALRPPSWNSVCQGTAEINMQPREPLGTAISDNVVQISKNERSSVTKRKSNVAIALKQRRHRSHAWVSLQVPSTQSWPASPATVCITHITRASVALRGIPRQLITDNRIGVRPEVFSAQAVNIVARIGRALLADPVRAFIRRPARLASIHVGITRSH